MTTVESDGVEVAHDINMMIGDLNKAMKIACLVNQDHGTDVQLQHILTDVMDKAGSLRSYLVHRRE